MAEKCLTSIMTDNISKPLNATKTFVTSPELRKRPKPKKNVDNIISGRTLEPDIAKTTANNVKTITDSSSSDAIKTNNIQNSIINSTANISSKSVSDSTLVNNTNEENNESTTITKFKKDDCSYLNECENDSGTNQKDKLCLDNKRKDQRDHENIGVYLETPVIDENNVSLAVHDFEKATVKPKRLSDDFFSSDDGEEDEHSELDTRESGISGGVSQMDSSHCDDIDVDLDVDDEDDDDDDDDDNDNGEDDDVDDNCAGQFLPETSNVFLADDTNSSCSNIIMHGTVESHLTKPNQGADITTTTAVHKSSKANCTSTSASSNDKFSCQAACSSGPITFYENDVQSMDAIERRDFEHEQRLTGGVIIKTSSLVNSDNKLNLEYLKSFKDGSKKASSENKCSTSKKDLSSTPTSSRCCTVRLTKSAAKLNLSATLDKSCSKTQNSNKDFANHLDNDISLKESTASSSASQCLRIGKHLDMFLNSNSNSNDSLSSDKSYNTSSNHSLPNFFSKRTNVEHVKYRASETLTNGTLSSSLSRKSDTCTNNSDNKTNNLNTYSDPIASTSSHSPRCQYSNFCCENKERAIKKETATSSLSTFGDTKKIPSSTVTSSSNGKQMCIYSADAGQYPSSSSSSSGSSHSSRTESRNYENQIIETAQISMPTEQTEMENDFDEETWADCEEDSDEEICTCYKYSNEYPNSCIEDELPSRDVDLSGYIQLVSISEDIFLQENLPTDTSSLQRKRKLNDSRTIDLENSFGETTPGGRKRLALSPRTTLPSSNQTLGISSPSTSYERRISRSLIPTKDNPPPELQDWLVQFQRWSHAERLLAVDRLIEHCEPTQVRHMMKVIEPQFQRDFISLLPRELALQVLSYLEPKDLLRAAQTCRSWRFLCDDNLLWKEKCKQAQIMTEPQSDRPKRGRAGNMPPISSAWKAAYMRQHIIEMNWRSRPIRQPKVLKGHDDHVITCLQFCGNRIVSGSDDNTLKVWSAISGKCLRTLVGHTGGVWSSQMSGNIIISGSTDRTLKVWDMESGQCIHTLLGHTSTVRCMHLHGNKVVSGSRDATLRVWDIEQGSCLHVLVGHLAAVRCVQYDGKLIVSGAYDYMVKVWNPERQECLHTLQGHTNRVYSLQFDGIHVVSGSLDTSIRVWDAETGSCKHTLMGHQSLTSGMELRQNILVSGNADSTVKVWDITTGQCLQTLSGPNKHQSAVTCLQFNSRFVITSSDDGTVKLWDVKTGEFIRNLVALDSGGSGGVVWRIRANDTKLICAVGSRNGTEETKLMVLDFDVEGACSKCS